MGHKRTDTRYKKQIYFMKDYSKDQYSFGGVLRNTRRGRKARPLSTKCAVHLVFKVDKTKIRKGLRSAIGFQICQKTIKKYAKRFYVKIEQLAICGDHIHILVRLSKRSFGQYFFRVVAGQIAQEFKNIGLWVTDTQGIWKYRPFTRVVLGVRAFLIAKNYVRLNEQEAKGVIFYKKERLRGLTPEEWNLLWK